MERKFLQIPDKRFWKLQKTWVFLFRRFATIRKQPMSAPAVFVWWKWKTPEVLVASCCMPVSPGMVVRTNTPAVRAAQKMIIELLWSSGDHNCLTCEQNGQCELQNLVYWLKIDKPRFEIEAPGYALDNSNTMIQRDLNKCILCGRCVRACNEIQVNEVLDFAMRSSNAKVGPAFDDDYINSSCVFCGECAAGLSHRRHHLQAGKICRPSLGT